MTSKSFTVTALVNKSPDDAFRAITNPRAWWGKSIEGRADRLGGEWTYRYKDMHLSTHKTTELVPGKRVVWHVVDSTLTFLTNDPHEWRGTDITFDIAPKGDKTEIRFTHIGLKPNVECYDICTNAWTGLIQESLRQLIETGEGDPDNVE
jgi:uncharacterized protein YndB with AHSA1/START domain